MDLLQVLGAMHMVLETQSGYMHNCSFADYHLTYTPHESEGCQQWIYGSAVVFGRWRSE